jgi:hypothetical protein
MASTTQSTITPDNPRYGIFWPLLLLLTALLVWFSFQLTQILKERDNQIAVQNNQETQLQNAGKLRATADALALGTYRLASQGNPNAKFLMDYLAKRGITINPPQQK